MAPPSTPSPQCNGTETRLRAQRVGIIGAGVSGILAARYLLAAGLDATVFERSAATGGIWLYDDRIPDDPSYPAMRPSEADLLPTDEDHESINCEEDGLSSEEMRFRFAPPGPCYEGLTNNLSTILMQLKGHPWPWEAGTNEYVRHPAILKYVQDASTKFGVDDVTLLNTVVRNVEKRDDGKWHIETTSLGAPTLAAAAAAGMNCNGNSGGGRSRDWEFDAVVVASGHYHAPRIPDILGLKEWKAKWPSRIQHSKRYRNPDMFTGQNILLVGGGTSSTEIARELGPVARKIYQSARGTPFDLPLDFLPNNCERVGEIASFEQPSNHHLHPTQQHPAQPIPLTVTFKDGTSLTSIHHILLCTGYHNSYPFLRAYHRDDLSAASATADTSVLVTDGTQVHNLHRDIFYTADPSLAFLGVSLFVTTFSFFEFQAMAVAAAFAGRVGLPGKEAMRREYEALLARRGPGRLMHAHHDEEAEYAGAIVGWLNGDGDGKGVGFGKGKVGGYSAEWHEANKVNKVEKIRERFRRERAEREAGERKGVEVRKAEEGEVL